ncbi:hypothetical protein Tco_0135411 [Tanacetum coccineum]
MAKSMVFICLLSLVLLIHNVDASNEFLVESTTCDQLNEKSRLQFGDTIVEKSLVVKIRQEDYIICDAPSPVDATKSSDYGYSMVKLNQIGPKYSISGIVENNKDKIIIHVIAGQRRSPPAPSQPQPQTLAESDGFLYFVFFVFGFVSCIVFLVLFVAFIAILSYEERRMRQHAVNNATT